MFFKVFFRIIFKVSEYLFKQNKNVLKNMTVLLYTYFYNLSLSVIRPTFFNNLPFLSSPNIDKFMLKWGQKLTTFSYFTSSCTNRIEVFNNFFTLISSQPSNKQNLARDFLFKYFLNNLLLIVFMQNTLLKLVELLQ